MVSSPNKTQGNRIYQYLTALTGTLGIVSSGMHYGWPSPSLPALTNGNYSIQVTKTEESWLAIMPLVGTTTGAVLTGLVIDTLGRKRLILFSSIPFFFSWIVIGLAETSVLLFVARFCAGVTDGLSFTAVPMYMGEIADPKIRGLLSSMCPVAIVIGLVLINILGNYLSISTAAFVASAVPATLLLTFMWMPESPYFLLMKERHEEARKSLQTLYGTQDVETELERLKEAVKEQNENSGKFLDLFTVSSNRKACLIALGLRTVQQVSGTTAITFYCKTIFQDADHFLSPNVATVIYFTIQLVVSVVSCFIVDKSGRRPLLIISLIGTILTLLVQGTYLYMQEHNPVDTMDLDFVPLISLLCFIVIFSIGLQTIPLLLMSEMFPTNVKAFAVSIADIYYSIIAALTSLFFHGTKEYGMYVPFYAFAACSCVGLVFVIFLIPETKGRTLEDIQMYLKGELKL